MLQLLIVIAIGFLLMAFLFWFTREDDMDNLEDTQEIDTQALEAALEKEGLATTRISFSIQAKFDNRYEFDELAYTFDKFRVAYLEMNLKSIEGGEPLPPAFEEWANEFWNEDEE